MSRPEQFPYLARLTIRVAPGAGTIICGASFLQDRLSIVKLVIVVAIIQWKYRNHYSPEGFCWRPSIASKTFTTIVADQLTALPGFEEMQILLKCHQFSRPGQFSWCCWDFLDYIWNLVSFRDLDNSHDRFGQFDIPLVDAFLRLRSRISSWQLFFYEIFYRA